MRASSRLGWVSMSFAASAPAYPDAPATRTLFTERPPEPLHGLLDRPAPLGDLLVGESAVGGPEGEAQRQALPSLAKLLAPVEVEDIRRAQQVAATLDHGGADLGGRDSLINHDRDVLMDGGIGDHVLVGLRADRRGSHQGREVDLEAGGSLKVPVTADEWMDLADPADLLVPDENAPGAPGVQEGLLTGHDVHRDTELPRQRLERRLERV